MYIYNIIENELHPHEEEFSPELLVFILFRLYSLRKFSKHYCVFFQNWYILNASGKWGNVEINNSPQAGIEPMACRFEAQYWMRKRDSPLV